MQLREVSLPLVAPFETSFGVEKTKQALLVILGIEGLTAYGECIAGSGPWYNEETIASAKYIIKSYLAPLLFRNEIQSPMEFLESANGIRGNNMAVAAVEMALWDLLGKTRKQSLSKLLGGEKKEVEVGVSVGIQPTPSRLVETIAGYLNDGYRRVKIKIKPGYDVDYVRAVRIKFPDLRLQVDANSAYRLDDAALLKKLDQFGLLLIEQPLANDDIIDHSKLQKQLSTPVCLDESIRSPADARKALEIDACRIINIKPGRVRGFERSREIHDLCRKQEIPVWCGGMLETGIGRAFNVALASLPGFTLPGDTSASKRYFRKDLLIKEFELTARSTLVVPTKPGIGVDVDQEMLDGCTVAKEILK